MIEKQTTLLADIKAITDDALAILNQGVKIGGVVQHLRAASRELETRVKYLAAETPKAKRKTTKPKEGKPADSTGEGAQAATE